MNQAEKSPNPKIKKKKQQKTNRATATESPKKESRAFSKKPAKAVEKPAEKDDKNEKAMLQAKISNQLKQLSELQNQVKELQTKKVVKKKIKVKKPDTRTDSLQPDKIDKIIQESKEKLKAVEKKTKKKKEKEKLSTSLPADERASVPREKSKTKKSKAR